MRKYELKARAEGMAETRQRIVEATAHLHQTIGPASTSISAIAEEAGVQRHTVYSHFPDERALFNACSGLFFQRRPLPDPASWAWIADPAARMQTALRAMYAYFRANERELGPVMRDLPRMPELIGVRLVPYRTSAITVLLGGRGLRGTRAAKARALLGLALRFETWRVLVHDEGLTDEQAADAMRVAVECAAGSG